MSKQELLNLTQQDLQDKLITENNPDNIRDIIEVMNLHLKKKEVIRTSILADTQDKIINQITKRVDKPDNFSNKDLIEYYKAVEDNIHKNSIENISIPQIQINQQVNINNPQLDIASKQRVLNALNAILNKDNNVIAVQESEEEITDE